MDIFWIIDMIIPAVIILMGFLYKYRAPKDINKFHGYRTTQSMKSQEAWDYAHSYGANIWIYYRHVFSNYYIFEQNFYKN